MKPRIGVRHPRQGAFARATRRRAMRGFMNLTTLSAIAVALLTLSNLFFFNLWIGAKDDLTTYRASVAQAQAQAESDAEVQRLEQQRVLADTANGWAAAVDYWRKHPVVRVLPAADCHLPQAGTVPATPAEPDARPPEYGLDPIVLTAEQCEARINNAILDAAQVKHLQSWIIQQHEASK